jgi:hypothetical protein
VGRGLLSRPPVVARPDRSLQAPHGESPCHSSKADRRSGSRGRPPESLKWELVRAQPRAGQPAYELRVNCGLEILRLQHFTGEEIRQLADLLAGHLP